MSEATTTGVDTAVVEIEDPVGLDLDAVDVELIDRLVDRARTGGLALTGAGGRCSS